MSDQRLAEIAARLAAATPTTHEIFYRGATSFGWDLDGPESGIRGQFLLKADAEFHAHAPADLRYLLSELARVKALLGWKTKQRLKATTNSERIALFGCSDEDTKGHSGNAVNEHGQVFSWWEGLGELDVEPLNGADPADPEYQAALAEVVGEGTTAQAD